MAPGRGWNPIRRRREPSWRFLLRRSAPRETARFVRFTHGLRARRAGAAVLPITCYRAPAKTCRFRLSGLDTRMTVALRVMKHTALERVTPALVLLGACLCSGCGHESKAEPPGNWDGFRDLRRQHLAARAVQHRVPRNFSVTYQPPGGPVGPRTFNLTSGTRPTTPRAQRLLPQRPPVLGRSPPGRTRSSPRRCRPAVTPLSSTPMAGRASVAALRT